MKNKQLEKIIKNNIDNLNLTQLTLMSIELFSEYKNNNGLTISYLFNIFTGEDLEEVKKYIKSKINNELDYKFKIKDYEYIKEYIKSIFNFNIFGIATLQNVLKDYNLFNSLYDITKKDNLNFLNLNHTIENTLGYNFEFSNYFLKIRYEEKNIEYKKHLKDSLWIRDKFTNNTFLELYFASIKYKEDKSTFVEYMECKKNNFLIDVFFTFSLLLYSYKLKNYVDKEFYLEILKTIYDIFKNHRRLFSVSEINYYIEDKMFLEAFRDFNSVLNENNILENTDKKRFYKCIMSKII